MAIIGLQLIQQISAKRSKRWHGAGQEFTGLEWAGAMCGEAGEAANVAKKIRRVELDVKRRPGEGELLALRDKLGEELADTVLYAVLLADNYGVDLADAVVAKFNATSEEFDFPERLVPMDVTWPYLRVLAERHRQQSVEGWSNRHDDDYRNGELATAAATYAASAGGRFALGVQLWPWARHWLKPWVTPMRQLEKAGALILAEMERLDRAESREAKR